MERPIIFQDWAVCAIIEGRKTQTRRVIKPQPPDKTVNGTPYSGYQKTTLPVTSGYDLTAELDNPEYIGKCLYGGSGDLLWVREAHQFIEDSDDYRRWIEAVAYRADRMTKGVDMFDDGVLEIINDDRPASVFDEDQLKAWRPSIHMPKWAARLWLKITDVRVERVQDISDEDCYAEGMPEECPEFDEAEHAQIGGVSISEGSPERYWLHGVWDSINAKKGHDWAANPWVWVIEFEKYEREGRV